MCCSLDASPPPPLLTADRSQGTAPRERVLGDMEREQLGRGCVGRAGRSREQEGRRPGSTEDQNKAPPAPLDAHWISKQEMSAEESGCRQPGVMNVWMSLLAKQRGSTEESKRALWLSVNFSNTKGQHLLRQCCCSSHSSILVDHFVAATPESDHMGVCQTCCKLPGFYIALDPNPPLNFIAVVKV